MIIVTAKSEKSELNPFWGWVGRGEDGLLNPPHRMARATCPRWPFPMGEGEVSPLVQPVSSPSLSFLPFCSAGLSTQESEGLGAVDITRTHAVLPVC